MEFSMVFTLDEVNAILNALEYFYYKSKYANNFELTDRLMQRFCGIKMHLCYAENDTFAYCGVCPINAFCII